jgi:Zn-dependent protease
VSLDPELLNPERLIPALIAAGILLLVGFPLHEFSHALMADRLGDRTARYMGRMSLNPIVHFDPLGGLILLVSAVAGGGFIIGWAKPTPVNPVNLRGGRRGEAWVALAGPVSNLLMAAIAAIPVRILLATGTPIADIPPVLDLLVYFNIFLFIFNLLPIPPLDGYRVLVGFLDARLAHELRRYEQYGFVLILVVFLLGGPLLVHIASSIYGFLVGV